MLEITLISSFHKIHGKCNPEELYKIIEQIRPDVIFEELSEQMFDIIYSPFHQPETVEAITIKKYLRKYAVAHYPVDNYPISESDLLSDAQIVWDRSTEYRELWNLKLENVRTRGYYFLNSDECVKILNKITSIEESVLTEVNNSRLLNESKREKALHDKREYEMLIGIYNFTRQKTYNKAIFICGAEHRQPIKQKVNDLATKENLKIKWKFFNEI